MLFTAGIFVGAFLPIVLLVFFGLGRVSHGAAAAWLFAASVFFYGYWMPIFTVLLLGSIAFNFLLSIPLGVAHRSGTQWGAFRARSCLLLFGVSVNLALLSYFKYANFFVENLNSVVGPDWHLANIVLPVGISFYTFTQIAFLVDTSTGKTNEVRPIHYGLFVTYFPHLIAGPVLHHAQMMPQFETANVYRFNSAHFLAGAAIFAIGLFKKVVLADGIAPYAEAVFIGADSGASPSGAEAWLGAWAYSFQLYFDFSGYSDMAIGLSAMFNIRLPFNFNSPYKAANISDFWRRWHMSLSAFLRDYLYVPLGGNRKGAVQRYVNLMVTMVLGGLWHGAAWPFVIWGALHGAYLMVNHAFRALCERLGWRRALDTSRSYRLAAWALTMLAAVVAWVVFRAQTTGGAGRVLAAMFTLSPGIEGVDLLLWNAGLSLQIGMLWCAVLGAGAFLLPNSNRIGERLLQRFDASPDVRWLIGAPALVAALALVLVNIARDSVSAFIYFNF